MGKIAGTIKRCGRYFWRCALVLLVFPIYSYTFTQEQPVRLKPQKNNADSDVKPVAYKSAFQSLKAVPQHKVVLSPEKPGYTIQICSLNILLDDPFLVGRYQIKVIHMGELYRYIFSSYTTVDAARKELPGIRKIFPKAFIREYDGQKLGKAIDLDIEH